MPHTDMTKDHTMVESHSDTASDSGQEANSPGKAHWSGTIHTHEALRGQKTFTAALSEQTQRVERAQDVAKLAITNRVVLAELDTLMTVAKDAIAKMVESSTRLVSTHPSQLVATPIQTPQSFPIQRLLNLDSGRLSELAVTTPK